MSKRIMVVEILPQHQKRQNNNKLRTRDWIFLRDFLAERVIFLFIREIPREEETFRDHPHFISGPPAVSTGPSFVITGQSGLAMTQRRRRIRFAVTAMSQSLEGFLLTSRLARANPGPPRRWN
jgi:hypothetical protein